MKIEDKVEHGT